MFGLLDSLSKLDSKTVFAALILLISGALLNRFIPFAWREFVSFCAWFGRRIGGRFAFRYFERIYLDWLVTHLRELKLTGIVTADPSKKPRLEQVFVSLRMGGDRAGISFMDCASAVCSEIKRNPRKRRSLLESLKRDLERAPSDQRKDAEEFIERSIGERKHAKSSRLILILDGIVGLLFRRSGFSDIIRNYFHALSVRMAVEGISPETEAGESDYLSTLFNQILRDNQRLAILGPPGSGKSTLLQYIGLAFAKTRAGDPKLKTNKNHYKCLGASKWKLPVFIPLSIVSQSLAEPLTNGNNKTILDVLPSILPPDLQNDPLATKFFQRKLLAGECIVLFDGLDEVPTEDEFKAVVNCIESFTVAHPKNQYIVTSRIAGWRSGIHADFKVFYISDLTDSQIDTFSSIWCDAVEQNTVLGRLQDEGQADRANRRRRAQQHADQLRSAIRSNGGIRQLASNPMLLSIIALVHHSLPDLPKERTKLYSECSKILLEQWDMSKGRRVDDTHLRLEQKELVLRRIAYALHTGEIGKQGGAREADRAEVEKLIASLLPNFNRSSQDASRLLTRLIERSGIVVERQRGMLAFSHLTFQEYFVALHLAKNKLGDFLLQNGRLFTDWWRETAVMYAGLLDDSSDFLKALNGYQYSDMFSTKLLLAGMCLGESQVVKQVAVRETICADLARLRTMGCLSGPPADFRELDGYLTDWSRSESARRHAVAFAVSFASNSEQINPHLERLESTIRDGDPEVVRLCISALLLIPQLSTVTLSDVVCGQIGKRDSKTSIDCLRILSRSLPATSSASLIAAFEAALQDSDTAVRLMALDVLYKSTEKSDLLQKVRFNIDSLLNDENWRVRQSAIKALSRCVTLHVPEFTMRLFELVDKEDDEDVLAAAFKAIGQILEDGGDDDNFERLTKLFRGKNEKVRIFALNAIVEMLDSSKRMDGAFQIVRWAIGSKSKKVQCALVESLQKLHSDVSIQQGIKQLTVIVESKSVLESANALRLLGVLRKHNTQREKIDRMLKDGLRSKNKLFRISAADGIAICESWPCDTESYHILLSMAMSHTTNVRLSALRAITATITPARGPETVEALRRGVLSDNPETRAIAAKAVARMGKAGGELKSIFINKISEDQLYTGLLSSRRIVSIRQIMSLFMHAHEYAASLKAHSAFREALVSLTTSKSDVQALFNVIAKKIGSNNKQSITIAVGPLIKEVGAAADKYVSIKSLEYILWLLCQLDKGFDGTEYVNNMFYLELPLIMDFEDESVLTEHRVIQ